MSDTICFYVVKFVITFFAAFTATLLANAAFRRRHQ